MDIEDVDRLVDLAGTFIPFDPFPYTVDNPGPYKVINAMGIEIDGETYRGRLGHHKDVFIDVPGVSRPLCFHDQTSWNIVVYHIRKAVYERDNNGREAEE